MIVRQENDSHDRSWTRDSRQRDGKDSNVSPWLCRSRVSRHSGSKDHLQTKEKEDDPSGELKRNEADSQVRKQNLACDQETEQDNSRDDDGAASYPRPLLD